MTRRIIQLELAAKQRARFVREASRWNYRASALAAAYRLGRAQPR